MRAFWTRATILAGSAPGRDFISLWNPVLWFAWCGVLGLAAFPFVVRFNLPRWWWLLDLGGCIALAVILRLVMVKIFRPHDDFNIVSLVALFVFLIPGILISFIAYSLAVFMYRVANN